MLVALLGCADPPPAPTPTPPPAPVVEVVPLPAWTVSDSGDLLGPDGKARLRLVPELIVRYDKRKTITRAERRVAPESFADGQAVYQLPEATWTVRLSTSSDGGRIEVEADVEYNGDVVVYLEALEWKAEGRVVDRAGKWTEDAVLVGAWTPQLLHQGDVLLEGHGLAVRAGQERWRVELDNAEEHPFKTLKSCVDKAWGKQEYDERSAIVRSGFRSQRVATIHPGVKTPMAWARFPRGFRAAMVFTDHADQSDPAKLEGLMYGPGGFVTSGLTMTKSVFWKKRSWYAKQLDDPAYVKIVERLVKDGVEIGPHSVTGARDSRDDVKQGLAAVAALDPDAATWIDHQPDTNCEAVTNQGWADGEWRVTDLLQEHGYRYVWAGYDVAYGDSLNVLQPGPVKAKKKRRPALYRHPLVDRDGKPLYLFTSMWRGMSAKDFRDRYDDDALDALVAENGLHIGHTYIDVHSSQDIVADWTHLRRKGRTFTVDPSTAALFARLAQRQKQGEIWVATMADLGDHLRAARGARLRYLREGVDVLSDTDVSGLVLGDQQVDLIGGKRHRIDGDYATGAAITGL